VAADAAAITLPPDSLLHLQLSGDLDALGLFEDDLASSSLALAAEAHESFMQLDDLSGLLGSQASHEEEHFTVCVEGRGWKG